MRSITVKLILSFISISVLSTVLVVAFTRWRSREEFRTFLIDQNRPGLVGAFSSYYQQHGSWDGIGSQMEIPQQMPMMGGPQIQHGPFTLVDSSTHRVVLAGEGYQVGTPVSPADASGGIPIR